MGLDGDQHRWILADSQNLLRFMGQETGGTQSPPSRCQLPRPAIDNLTNWYIRFNRKRLKGAAGLGVEDTTAARNTLLQEVLFNQAVKLHVFAMWKVIQLGRAARERRGVSLKTPLLSLVVIADSHLVSDVKSLKSYVQEKDEDREYRRTQTMEIKGHNASEGDLTLIRVVGKGRPVLGPAFTEDMIVLLDTAPHPELVEEGVVRELINRFQRLGKKAGLVPTDELPMRFHVVSNLNGGGFESLVAARQDLFVATLLWTVDKVGVVVNKKDTLLEEQQAIGDTVVVL
ncbi:hypothetical protein C7999DRAFT_41385 [Corynascus novoguineensis]|uniref:Uncharacterized protein n=1 Tax=Corynascus novoguineensis TaxID=1126955 RepID=A0AAN7CU66_9PEZI|nr:hypothetical protein C7999DRAFT_41385 [Corynascus novoguineensis]